MVKSKTLEPASELWAGSEWVDGPPPDVARRGPDAEWADIAEALKANPGKVRRFVGRQHKGTGSYLGKKYGLQHTTRKAGIDDRGFTIYELYVWAEVTK